MVWRLLIAAIVVTVGSHGERAVQRALTPRGGEEAMELRRSEATPRRGSSECLAYGLRSGVSLKELQ